MDGIFTLQISKDIVPDFAMAKIDDFSICDLIFSSPMAPQFLNPSFNKRFWINCTCSVVE